jgi:hypothetical protein
MFPFAVVIMTGGMGYYVARFLGRETIMAYFLAKRLRKKAGKFEEA